MYTFVVVVELSPTLQHYYICDLTFVGDLPGHLEEQQVLHRQLVFLPGGQQPTQGGHGEGT